MPASQYGNSKAKPKAKAKVAAKPKVGKAKKPDFLDLDNDGEPMKKAKKKPAAKKAPKKSAPKKSAVGKIGGSLARAREANSRTMNPSMGYA
jgi:hypothetical protein